MLTITYNSIHTPKFPLIYTVTRFNFITARDSNLLKSVFMGWGNKFELITPFGKYTRCQFFLITILFIFSKLIVYHVLPDINPYLSLKYFQSNGHFGGICNYKFLLNACSYDVNNIIIKYINVTFVFVFQRQDDSK